MNLSDNFKKFMGMVEQNAQQLKKDLTPTPLPSGPEVWEAGKEKRKEIEENILKKRKAVEELPQTIKAGVRTAIYGGDPEKDARLVAPDYSPETPGWQDKEDAARHLLAIGGIAQKTNPMFAKTLASVYEFVSGSEDELDAQMDEHNNQLALQLFNAKDYDEVKQRVKKLMESAQYRDFSDKDKPVFLKLGQE